ncbi:hypothetical protein [Chitinophaga sp. CF418]|uniref:hypothetical protein n=1 Tax=Chitinophaga sp. CF418 TaxID=1855287 RepID=UPI00091B7067|nr:hypothetical protein [Chitinophaga sp. CF418]SHN45666.1 hypothetical protein SAMN05216311_1217 [Chitinophaga sp. CF418]
MKKAKIILSVITVLAIVAGAYAFKAARSQFFGYKTTTVYYIGTDSYITLLPFCTSTITLLTFGPSATVILYTTTTTTATSTRQVHNGMTAFTITVSGCTSSFSTSTTNIEG